TAAGVTGADDGGGGDFSYSCAGGLRRPVPWIKTGSISTRGAGSFPSSGFVSVRGIAAGPAWSVAWGVTTPAGITTGFGKSSTITSAKKARTSAKPMIGSPRAREDAMYAILTV